MNSPWVENHALEGTVLDILIVVGDMDPPLAGLVRLERCVECAIVFADWAAQWPVCWGVGGHFQQVRPGSVVRVDQNLGKNNQIILAQAEI